MATRRPFIRIITDGTPFNTIVFGPDGEPIEGIISVTFPPIDSKSDKRATIECYVEDKGPVEPTAKLGLATTAELLNELQARAELGGYATHRTVDCD